MTKELLMLYPFLRAPLIDGGGGIESTKPSLFESKDEFNGRLAPMALAIFFFGGNLALPAPAPEIENPARPIQVEEDMADTA